MTDVVSPYHHGNLDLAALDAAETILRDDGEAAVTMRAVARKVGVTHRALYRWRPDRRALLAGLAERGCSRLAALLRAAVIGAEHPKEAFARTYLQFARTEPQLYALTMSRHRNEYGGQPALRAAMDDLVAISRETSKGVTRDPRDVINALWSLLHGATMLMDAGLLDVDDDEQFIAYATRLGSRT